MSTGLLAQLPAKDHTQGPEVTKLAFGDRGAHCPWTRMFEKLHRCSLCSNQASIILLSNLDLH
eukprot:6131384-Amphidinium_carterae.1